jgi:hypothetical protein
VDRVLVLLARHAPESVWTIETSRAFILFACWEQANLRGSPVTLYKLEEQEALMEIESIFFKLYRETGHLRQQIGWKECTQLFETIWCGKATHAGWKLESAYADKTSVLHFVDQPCRGKERQ